MTNTNIVAAIVEQDTIQQTRNMMYSCTKTIENKEHKVEKVYVCCIYYLTNSSWASYS